MLWHRSLGLGIIIKLTAPWIVGKALRTGKESYRGKKGRATELGKRTGLSFIFLEKTTWAWNWQIRVES